MHTKFLATIALLLSVLTASAQRAMSTKEYIDTYKEIAIEQMKKHKIPASITLAQGIIESGSGSSRLAVKANNHFGIKCGKGWSGAKIYHNDDRRGECFRKYRSARESYVDHSVFLTSGARYAALFDLKITDYKGWARGLKTAGYATNPQYANILIRTIESNNLHRFDTHSGVVAASKEGLAKQIDKRGRQWGYNNDVKYVVALANDSFERIAQQYHIKLDKLLQINDLNGLISLREGVAVYVKSKKNSSSVASYHVVKPGETVHSIAQKYGIKVKALKSHNRKLKKREIEVGEQLKLQ